MSLLRKNEMDIEKDYLTEEKLGIFLEELFGHQNVKSQVTFKSKNVIGKNIRVDYLIEGQEFPLVVEFDGPQHYKSDVAVMDDIIRDSWLYENSGILVYRVPYWVQLNHYNAVQMFMNYKGYAEIVQASDKIYPNGKYPDGFISKKAPLPTSFSYLGLERFVTELLTNYMTYEEDVDNEFNAHVVIKSFEDALDRKPALAEKEVGGMLLGRLCSIGITNSDRWDTKGFLYESNEDHQALRNDNFCRVFSRT